MKLSPMPLDLNESYWLLDDATISKLSDLPRAALGVYPSYESLTEEIAGYLEVGSRAVCLTPGSDEAIRAVMQICAKRRYRALLPLPTFSGYERVLMETPLETARVYYREGDSNFLFPVEETLQSIRAREIDVVFLCEPNNPLGNTIEPAHYTAILNAAAEHDVLIVADEAYGEYGGSSAISRIGKQKIVVLRTLSKAFGAPGIRVGYSISDEEFAREMRTRIFGTLPWPIPGPSVHIARSILAHRAELSQRRALVIEERGYFTRALDAFEDITVFPSVTNFVLARVPEAKRTAAALFSAGIRVGIGEEKTWDAEARELLRSTLRFAVPSPDDRPSVIKALAGALETRRIPVV